MPAIPVERLPAAGDAPSASTNNSIAFVAMDVGGDTIANGGKEFFVIYNGDAAQQTVDITGAAASDNGEGDASTVVTVTLDAGDMTVVGPFKRRNYGSPISVLASAATVEIAALSPVKGG